VFARLSTTRPPSDPVVHFDRVVVLGASVAGLLAARVLADHARSVVIIEKDDTVAAGPVGPRPGVPQGAQIHILLPAGLVQVERWFPGFAPEAVAAGAVHSAFVNYLDGVPQAPDPIAVLVSTRPLLEALIRRRSLARPNVELITGQATGLGYRDGAVTRVHHRTDDGEQVLEADFVVDAMGRSSRLSTWLEQDGWDRPVLERIPTNIKYATALFERADENVRFGLVTVHNSRHFAGPAMGLLNAVEGGRWMMAVAGYDHDLDGSEEDFRTRIKQLPPVFEEMARGRLIGEIQTYQQSDSRRRRYAGLERFPAGLVSVGDAVASFNPIFGQGVASATLHASALSEYLQLPGGSPAPSSEFFERQQVVVDVAWQISTLADIARKKAADRAAAGTVAPAKPLMVRLARWALGQVHRAAAVDQNVVVRRNAVVFMLAHPRRLASPGLIARAIVVNRRRRRPGPDPLAPDQS
jgi:2-polyprenyl-6-methoxyphenol hydroxylase-like FAD-dependent oxidoreductase